MKKSKNKSQNKRKIVITIIIIVVLALLGFGAYILLKPANRLADTNYKATTLRFSSNCNFGIKMTVGQKETISIIKLTENSIRTINSNGKVLPTNNDTIAVSCLDPGYATRCDAPALSTSFSHKWQLKAKKAGNVKIQVMKRSEIIESCPITIYDKPKSISINNDEIKLAPGEKYTFAATIKPTTAFQKVKWKSSNTNVATIDDKGKVTAKNLGQTIITATANDDSSIFETSKVIVKKIDTSIPSSSSSNKNKSSNSNQTTNNSNNKFSYNFYAIMNVGKSQTITSPSTKISCMRLSGSSIAVSDNCYLVATSLGSTTVRIIGKNGGYYDQVISVVQEQKSPTFNYNYPTSIGKGKQGNVNITYIDWGTESGSCKFTSSNSSVLSINSTTGALKGLKIGSATVTVKCGSSTGSSVINVVSNDTFTFAGTDAKLYVGTTTVFTPVINGTLKANKNVKWKSSDPSIATIDANGKITGKKAGTTKITGTYEGMSVTVNAKVKKDSTKPVIKSFTHSSNGKWTNKAKLSWNIIENESGIKNVQYRLNKKGDWKNFGQSEWYGFIREKNRNDKLEIRVVDKSGNISNVISTTLKIDTTKPKITNLTNSTGKDKWSTNSTKISWKITENESGIKNVQYRLNKKGDWKNFGKSEWNGFTRDKDRNDIVEIRTVDNAGNISNVVSTTLKIDKTAPTIIARVYKRDTSVKNSYTGLSNEGIIGQSIQGSSQDFTVTKLIDQNFPYGVVVRFDVSDNGSGITKTSAYSNNLNLDSYKGDGMDKNKITTNLKSVNNYSQFVAVDGNGKRVVKYTVTDNSGHSKTMKVKIDIDKTKDKSSPAKKIVLNNNQITINRGRSYEAVAIVLPGNAKNREVTWKSGDESIATVDSNGLIYGIKAGQTTITATSKENPSIYKTVTVTVKSSNLNINYEQFDLSLKSIMSNEFTLTENLDPLKKEYTAVLNDDNISNAQITVEANNPTVTVNVIGSSGGSNQKIGKSSFGGKTPGTFTIELTKGNLKEIYKVNVIKKSEMGNGDATLQKIEAINTPGFSIDFNKDIYEYNASTTGGGGSLKAFSNDPNATVKICIENSYCNENKGFAQTGNAFNNNSILPFVITVKSNNQSKIYKVNLTKKEEEKTVNEEILNKQEISISETEEKVLEKNTTNSSSNNYDIYDLNCDGNIDITDVSIVLSLMPENPDAKFKSYLTKADVNNDSGIDITDLMLILNNIGKPVEKKC